MAKNNVQRRGGNKKRQPKSSLLRKVEKIISADDALVATLRAKCGPVRHVSDASR